MLRWLRKYFIPHPGNLHQPHFLRRKNIGLLIGILGISELLFLIQAYGIIPQNKFLASILPTVLVSESNYRRKDEALNQLATNPILEEAAKRKAEDMAQKGYFAHTSPEGVSPWHWFEEVGYAYSYAGENLAVNFTDSKDVVDAWMNSPSHRANILNKKFTEIGIGTAEGIYRERKAIYIVQLFGRPAPAISRDIVSVGLRSGSGINEPPPARNPKGNLEYIATPRETAVPDIRPESQEVAVRGIESDVEIVSLGTNNSSEAHGSLANIWLNPYRRTQAVISFLGGLTLLALLLKIFIKIERQHPKLILSGVLILLIVGSALFVNQGIALGESRIF